MTIVTKDSLQLMLDHHNPKYVEAVVGRALTAIFKFQTEDEQTSNATTHHNGVGFTGADGYGGSLTAKYWMKHNSLQPWMIEKWTAKTKSGYARLAKYHRQLNDISSK